METGRRRRAIKEAGEERAQEGTLGLDISGFLFRPRCLQPVAVSNHSGTTMGGHYTAYCRSPVTSEWLRSTTPGETGLGAGLPRPSGTRPSRTLARAQECGAAQQRLSRRRWPGCPIGQRRSPHAAPAARPGPPGCQADLSCSLRSVSPCPPAKCVPSDACSGLASLHPPHVATRSYIHPLHSRGAPTLSFFKRPKKGKKKKKS